jgi:predicted permease
MTASGRSSSVLLITQVSLSTILIVSAGLLLRTVENLRDVNVGFAPDRLLVFRVSPQLNRYEEHAIDVLYRRLLDRFAAIPGVEATSLSAPGLLAGGMSTTGMYRPGQAYRPEDRPAHTVHRNIVAPEFRATMGIPLVAGRDLGIRDASDAPAVAMINEAAARKFFPGESPLGQRFGTEPSNAAEREVVGVVADVRYSRLREPPPPTIYVPFAQTRVGSVTFALRTAGDPLAFVPQVRSAVRETDPALSMFGISTQAEQMEARIAGERTLAYASAICGALAVAIAAVGLLGMMSFRIARRTRELAIRRALGATAGDVLGTVSKDVAMVLAVGLLTGAIAAAGLTRFLSAELFEVAAFDPASYAAAVMILSAAGAIAVWVPARRALRVHPALTLSIE